MRSMFWKLFVSFCLTMILGGAMSVAVISTFQHLSIQLLRDNMSREMDDNLTNLIVLSGQAALQMFRCGGRAEYDTYVSGLKEGAGIGITLIGADNRAITGEVVPDELVGLTENTRRDHRTSLHKTANSLTVAKELSPEDGASPVVVGVHIFGPPPGMRPPDGKEPPFFIRILPPFFGHGELIRIAVMLLMVSAVCSLLARSLATPIRRLQKIAQQIAGGDYSARVGKSLGRSGNEIADLGRDFDIMVERTEKVITSQKRLLRDISHELRSPLARLNVALEVAKKRLDAEGDSALAKIGKEADRLNELIGHLLTLTRLESGAPIQAMEPVDLTELVREVAADVDFEAVGNGRGVTIVASAAATVTGSRELLRRAVENIVRNGAQYSADGTQVEISLVASNQETVITISDFGPGVPEPDLPQIFEPFYRVAEARERRSGGTGIGLAIALQAVKAHGGTVVARNGLAPHGLIVTITLPLSA